MSQEEKIITAIGSLRKIANMLSNNGVEGINELFDHVDHRLATASFSMTKSEPYCGVGMLAVFILDLVKKSKTINDMLLPDVDKISVIKCAILCDIGRIGNEEEDRFVMEDSDWHKEKLGRYFKWNEKCEKYFVPHSSLYWANKFGINLSFEETLAIIQSQGHYTDESRFYLGSESKIATCIQWARKAIEIDFSKPVYELPF